MKPETTFNWKDEITSNIGNPEILEKLFRTNPKAFKTAFDSLPYETEDAGPLKFWKARLDYDARPDILKGITFNDLVTVIGICLVTAFLIKLPGIFPSIFSDEVFYQKNASIIVILPQLIYLIKEKVKK